MTACSGSFSIAAVCVRGEGSALEWMKLTQILLTHAEKDDRRAALVARRLQALGIRVTRAIPGPVASPRQRRKLEAQIDGASQVIMLWSSGAGTPALRAAASRARSAGKLTLAHLDKSLPPGVVRGAPSLKRLSGRQAGELRMLAAAASAAPKGSAASRKRKRRGGSFWLPFSLTVAALGALAAAGYYYFAVLG